MITNAAAITNKTGIDTVPDRPIIYTYADTNVAAIPLMQTKFSTFALKERSSE